MPSRSLARSRAPSGRGGLRPRFPRITLNEASILLQGLYGVNLSQLSSGVPGINEALISGRVRYIRGDPNEIWQPIRTIWELGGGDCEDLAAAVAAELSFHGVAAHPVIYRSGPHMAHAVVKLDSPVVTLTGSSVFGHPVIAPNIIDPSRTGGM